MSEEGLESTKIEKPKGIEGQSEVDALIAGALAELGNEPKKEVPKEKVLSATPITITPSPRPSPTHPTGNVPQVAAPSQVKPLVQKETPMTEEESIEASIRKFHEGALIKGKIAQVDQSGILVDIGYKSDGFLPSDEIPEGAKIGDEIDATIEKLENKEGYVLLSRRKAEQELRWKRSYDAMKDKEMVSAQVKNAVKGGLVVEFEGIRGFIPASQVSKSPEQKLEDFVGQAIPAKVIEVNRRQGKVVLSHRLGAIESDRKEAEKVIDHIESGQVMKGKVTNLKNFGAFVDIGGIEGLVHLSELSWKRVRHPSELLKVGQEVEVLVLGVDKVSKKVSLGLKELQPDPWAQAVEKYRPGQIVKAKVLRLAKFGAFVEIEEGLEGLVHISELSKNKIQTPDEAVKPGEVLDFKILRIVPEEQRIGLSLKGVQIEQEKRNLEAKAAEENKVTIGDVLAEKERVKTEKEAEEEWEEEVPSEPPPE